MGKKWSAKAVRKGMLDSVEIDATLKHCERTGAVMKHDHIFDHES